MRFQKLIWLILVCAQFGFAQKNAITARPLPAFFGQFGLQYERLVYKHWSLVLHGEYMYGPLLLSNQIETWIRNSMDIAEIRYFAYEGYGGVPEVRYYFKDKRPKELEEIDPTTENKITGWFLGAYFPVRKVTLDMRVTNPELHLYAVQSDFGRFQFDGWTYGAGLEGGRHWVWGNFSLDIFMGLGYSTGLGGLSAPFKFNRDFNDSESEFNRYEKNKYLGVLGLYAGFVPRIGLSIGVAF